jgi:hypothetical protein
LAVRWNKIRPLRREQRGTDLDPKLDAPFFDKPTWLSLIGILIATALAYRSVLFNFFCGDDFVHLEWLNRAITQHELIWKNFYSNWLDVPTCQFYRPVISIFMVCDYAFWRNNGLGFHLTNLASHLASTLTLYLVLTELNLRAGRSSAIWPICSAALFALYPLHPEAVSWITGRVDTIVTMFCFASFWCYLKARRSGNALFLIASLVLFALSLGSKELAIIEPAVLFLLEWLLPKDPPPSLSDRSVRLPVFSSMKECLIPTLPFWFLLVIYFLIRRFGLGTFVGGYDDSLQISGNMATLKSWLRSLKIIFVPFNSNLFSVHDGLKVLWVVTGVTAVALFIRRCLIERASFRLSLFLIVWFFLSLVPLFKLLNLAGDLEGSRLVYMATGPYCACLCFGCFFEEPQNKRLQVGTWIGRFVAFGLIALSYIVLIVNNRPWRESGLQSQAILLGLDQIYAVSAANPPTYLLGLPDSVCGAYLIRNALDGMTRSPQIKRDVRNCFVLDNFDPIFPFGFAKRVIERNAARVRVFVWDFNGKYFKPYVIPRAATPTEKSWSGDELMKMYRSSEADRKLVISPPNLSCWPSKCVVIRFKNSKSSCDASKLSLNYTNELISRFDWRHRVAPYVYKAKGAIEAAFLLQSEIDWVFGGECRDLTLLSGQPGDWLLEQVRVEGPDRLLPRFSFVETSNQNQNGFIELTPKFATCRISYDVCAIPDAAGVRLELTKPNRFFEVRNSAAKSTATDLVRSYSGASGLISLRKDDFPKDAIYQARIRAVDRSGESIGFASDHILITVRD